jgi:microcystin-dependent protein
MPRNGSGVASVVNTFTPLTTADANQVNDNFTDMADMLTDSLPRDGQAGMTGQFLAISGTQTEPGIAFSTDPNTGFRRPSGDSIAAVCGGDDILTVSTTVATVTVPVAVNDAPTTGDHLTNKTYVDAQVATAVARMPAGVVAMHAASTAPTGWLECNGTAVSRTTYAALFTAISTTWGAGDGSTTFNVPDLRGEFVRGWDHGKGTDAGRTFASSQTVQTNRPTSIRSNVDAAADFDTVTIPESGESPEFDTGGTALVGAATRTMAITMSGLETRPRNIALMYIIKT